MGTMLEKVHRMNVLLQKSAAESIDFKEMSELLSETLRANVYVVSKSGKILGYGMAEYALTAEWERIMNVDGRFPGAFNDTLLSFSETAVNLQNKEKLYVFSEEENETFRQKNIMIVPVVGGENAWERCCLPDWIESLPTKTLYWRNTPQPSWPWRFFARNRFSGRRKPASA